MNNPTPATQTTPATHTTRRRVRAPALAALAAAAILLGACGGGGGGGDGSYQRYTPASLDLPEYDPEPGSDRDALVYPDTDMAISAIDGREVSIGHKYWYKSEYSEGLAAAGPWPSYSVEGRGYLELDYITHDSALLSPGRHEMTVLAVEASLQSSGQYSVGGASGPIALSFDVEPRATYRLFRIIAPESDGKGFWALMVKSTCPLLDEDWIWPTAWNCYKDGLIVASNNTTYVGMRVSEVYKPE